MKTEIAQLRAFARDIRQLKPADETEISLVGFMAGAIYSLLAAAELQYDDARASPGLVPFASEFAITLDAIEQGGAPPVQWVAGLHCHSGLMRLDAIDSRMAKVIPHKPARGSRVRNAVNSLKHDKDAHLSAKHPVTFADAVAAVGRLTAKMRQAIP